MIFSKFEKRFVQPYIIAEIGVNHNCNIKLAKKQILLAKKGGANAVKFQTYKAEKIASKFSKYYWDLKEEKTKSQFSLFKKYDHFSEKDYNELALYCKKIKIDFSSTPFDIECVNYLKKIVKFFKIASSDITNFQLLEKVAKTKLPMVISTGASTIREIKEAVKFIRKFNKKKITILHCTLSYPTQNKNANIGAINDLRLTFPDNYIGYSDHTKSSKNYEVLSLAYLFGAIIIEKHFTHNKRLKGNDHYHSFDNKDLKNFRKKIDEYISIYGKGKKVVLDSEKKSRLNARRSLIINKNLKKGSRVKKNDISIKRPGIGIQPKFFNKVVGKKLKKDKTEDQVIFWNDFF